MYGLPDRNILRSQIDFEMRHQCERAHHSGFIPLPISKHFRIHLSLWVNGIWSFPSWKHILRGK